ncbi:unnamed protein product [Brassica rapa subsp. trilocularis]
MELFGYLLPCYRLISSISTSSHVDVIRFLKTFSIVDVSGSSGLFESKSAARRLLKQGGVYMNNERVDDENKRVEVGT